MKKIESILKSIKNTFYNSKANISLIDFVKQYAEERRRPGEKRYQGRCGSVLTLVKHLENFGAHKMKTKNVDTEFCKQFIDYLRQAQDLHHHMKNKKRIADNTIHLKCTILKAILREAVRQRLLSENPMDYLPSCYRTRTNRTEKPHLSMEELKKMMQTECPIPLLKEAFLFSCLTGLRKSDVLELKPSDLRQEDDQHYYIYKKIKKTQQWLTIPLSNLALDCLPSSTAKESKYFASLSSARLALMLRRWMNEAHITQQPINFHTARHTFATLELNMGADIYTVSQLLGHHNIATTQIYSQATNSKKAYAVSLQNKLTA